MYSFAVCMLVDLQDVTGSCSKATLLFVCCVSVLIVVEDSDVDIVEDMMLL